MNIKEAAERTGTSPDTIRYYEKIGLIPSIDRTDVGVRAFDKRILGRITFVRQMRSAGMSIENLLTYMHLVDSDENNILEQKKLLKEQLKAMEEKLDDLQSAISHLQWKLDHYEDHMKNSEKELVELEKAHAKRQQGWKPKDR
ncbi:MerR family transcriptional regulator [Bifidobacterium psychraerophilum]|uniref:MerR family transcriptional regulator n=1 Tax=Bifidobacterium psychraerophilum TaxID=218140 RepID=UPI0039EA07AA